MFLSGCRVKKFSGVGWFIVWRDYCVAEALGLLCTPESCNSGVLNLWLWCRAVGVAPFLVGVRRVGFLAIRRLSRKPTPRRVFHSRSFLTRGTAVFLLLGKLVVSCCCSPFLRRVTENSQATRYCCLAQWPVIDRRTSGQSSE